MAAQNLPRIKKTRIAVHTIPPLESFTPSRRKTRSEMEKMEEVDPNSLYCVVKSLKPQLLINQPQLLINPNPETRNPKSETRHPKTGTRNTERV